MKEIFEYKLDSAKKKVLINIYALLLVVVSYPLFGFILFKDKSYTEILNIPLFLIATITLLIIHELIHGLFFKIFRPHQKVVFKFSLFACSASAKNEKFNRNQYLIIILAPFFIITTVLLILGLTNITPPGMTTLLLAIHTGGCIGDFIFSYYILKNNRNCLFEDTGDGFKIYEKELD